MRHAIRAAASVSACLVVTAGLGACGDATGPDRERPDGLVTAPAASAAVPLALRVRQQFHPPPYAIAFACEPVELGVVVPSHLVAIGNGTHLGRVRSLVTGVGCALDPSGALLVWGLAVHTAANGDALEASWSGTLSEGALALNVLFTGGTGRFAGAAGSGTLHGTLDYATGAGEWELAGWLTRAR